MVFFLNSVYCLIKRILKLNCLLAKAYKRYTTAIFTHLVAKLYKNKTLRCSFKATADAAVNGKIYIICSMPELSERNFRDGLEMMLTLPVGGIQQAGAPETAAKSVTPCFTFG